MDGRWGGARRHRAAAIYSTLTVPPGHCNITTALGLVFPLLAYTRTSHHSASCSDVTASHTAYIYTASIVS